MTPTPCQAAKDPDAWFPDTAWNNKNYRRKAAPAEAACLACHARATCLEKALGLAVAGVWGGMGEDLRRAEQKKRGIIPEPVVSWQPPGRQLHNTPLGGPDDPRHGRESTYSKHACRCPPCTQAHSVAKAERRERDRERGAA